MLGGYVLNVDMSGKHLQTIEARELVALVVAVVFPKQEKMIFRRFTPNYLWNGIMRRIVLKCQTSFCRKVERKSGGSALLVDSNGKPKYAIVQTVMVVQNVLKKNANPTS